MANGGPGTVASSSATDTLLMRSNLLVVGVGIKVAIMILSIIVLILLEPVYTVTYLMVNYQIVVMYIVPSLTLLYCVVSIIMCIIMCRREAVSPLTNCAFTEIIFASAGMIGWMQVLGIGATIVQSTILETGDRYGWIGAMAGINVVFFMAIAGLFCLSVVSDKILSRDRRLKYAPVGQYEEEFPPRSYGQYAPRSGAGNPPPGSRW